VKIGEAEQKIKSSAPTNNQIYGVPANQFSPSASTTLVTILADPYSSGEGVQSCSMRGNLEMISVMTIKTNLQASLGTLGKGIIQRCMLTAVVICPKAML